MAQHDYFLDNQTAANYRAEHNLCLAAIVSQNSGDTEPSPTFAFQIWVDTSGANDVVKQRNSANTAWIEIYQLTASAQSLADLSVEGNITVGGTVDGRDVAADGTKLDGIESGATADQTAAEILTEIKTVDGTTSGLDADLLDGQEGTYYLDRANHTGNLPGGTFSGQVEATAFAVTNGGTIGDTSSTGLGSVNLTGGSTGGYVGYAINDSVAFVENDNQDTIGIRDVANDRWIMARGSTGKAYLYYQGNNVLVTESYGVNIQGELELDTELRVTGTQPQIKFQDNGTEHDFWIHVNSNNFYVLADRDGDDAWETPHPLQLEADTNDAYVFGRRIIDNGNFSVDGSATATSFAVTNGGTIGDVTGQFGSVSVSGGATGGYSGYAIGGDAVFMSNSSYLGLYDDTNNHWALLHTRNSRTQLYYDGSAKINTESYGALITGYARADNGFFVDGTTYGITGSAYFRTASGSAGSPGLAWGVDTNTGIYRSGSDQVMVATGGGNRFRVASGSIYMYNVYSSPTDSGRRMRIQSDGRVRSQTSSRRYKRDIEPMEAEYATKILNEAQPVYYRLFSEDPEYPQQYLDSLEDGAEPSIEDCLSYCTDNDIDWNVDGKIINDYDNLDWSHWGFIAEDLAEVDPRLCYQDPDTGNIDDVYYEKFAPVLLKIAQMQKAQIASLEQRIAALEAGAT